MSSATYFFPPLFLNVFFRVIIFDREMTAPLIFAKNTNSTKRLKKLHY